MRLYSQVARLATAAALAASAHLAGAPAATAQAKSAAHEGWRQYMVHCARCHGDDAMGGVMAPDLRTSVSRGMDEQSFATVVLEGRREKGMPGLKGQLTDAQVKVIYDYVAGRASGKIKAGRPA
ncbi:MAG TPA: cytochrome c [Gemmatimonadales bacterium]|jgi:cytochrome c|nr:cytochrome c [Gemmatimonadales bacterium]